MSADARLHLSCLPEVSYKCTWFGHKIPISVQDEEKAIKAAPCPTMLFAPAYKLQWPGLTVGLCPLPILFSLLTHNSLHGKHRQDSVTGMEARQKLYPFHTPCSCPFSSLCIPSTSPLFSHVQQLLTLPPLVLHTPTIPECLDGDQPYHTVLPKLSLLLHHTTTTK